VRLTRPLLHLSLAARISLASAFFGLLVAGGAIVLGLHALAQQLEARAATELGGKRDRLVSLLAEMPSPVAIEQNQQRFGDLLIGHVDLHLALADPRSGKVIGSFSPLAQDSLRALQAAVDGPNEVVAWEAHPAHRLIAVKGVAPTADKQPVRYYLSLDRLKPEDATMKAITDAGFVVPDELKKLPGSNVARNKYYDQIAYYKELSAMKPTGAAGIFDFYEHVYRATDEMSDEETYKALWGTTKSTGYKDWRTYQMSDHLPMWIEMSIDDSAGYLNWIATYKRGEDADGKDDD
jgi:hypothetical protein